MDSELIIRTQGGQLVVEKIGKGITTPVSTLTYHEGEIIWINSIAKPMKMKLTFTGVVSGVTISGKVKAGFMGRFPFTAVKQ